MRNDSPVVVVIGAGIIGCTSAYHLAKAGCRVEVVEQGKLCREASWASAGIIHEEITPIPSLTEFRRKSVAMFPGLHAELSDLTGVDSTYRQNGGFRLCPNEEEWPETQALYRAHLELDIPCELLSTEEVLEKEPALSPDIRGGIYFRQNGYIDPRRYTEVMAQAAMQRGVKFHFGRPVTGFEREGDRITGVKTPQGALMCDVAVICAGAWSGLVADGLGINLPMQPVRGQMLRLEAVPPLIQSTVHCGKLYLVARRDGSVLVGSTEEHEGFRKRVTPAGTYRLLEMVHQLAPGLTDATLADTWCGLRPYPERELPYLGPVPGLEGAFVAAGHFRSGVIDSPLTGQIVADVVTGKTPAVSLEPFALPGLQTKRSEK